MEIEKNKKKHIFILMDKIRWYGSQSVETDPGVQLFEKGFTLVNIFDNDEEKFKLCNNFVCNKKFRKWVPIGHEPYRKMTFVPDNHPTVQFLAKKVLHAIGVDTTLESSSPFLWKPSILLSLPGCGAQPFHLDNEPDDFNDFNILHYPVNAIIAFDDDTYIDVLEDEKGNVVGCTKTTTSRNYKTLRRMVLQNNRKEYRIPKGHAFVFRGDFIHAGSKFHALNSRRLHLYFVNKYEMRLRKHFKNKFYPTTYWLDGR